ncbi:MAG: hypothetical protein RJQ04_06960 [Longimicrobiales bacterium]
MTEQGRGVVTVSRDWVWPVGIAVALSVVVLVNVVFIWVAVKGADPVAPAYVAGER